MEHNNKSNKKNNLVTAIVILVMTVAAYIMNCCINDLVMQNLIKNGLLGLVLGIVLLLVTLKSTFKMKSFLLVLTYFLGLSAGILTHFISIYTFPLIALFIIFYILSDEKLALVCILAVLMLSSINLNQNYQFMIIIPTCILVLNLLDIVKLDSIALPVIAINLFYVFLYAVVALNTIQSITPDVYLFPAVGVLLNMVISIIVLFTYRRYILLKYSEEYIKINDPEYDLLLKLKEKNINEYKIAIHTAYLCDRVCSNLELDRTIAKCLGYYHRIGVIEEGKIYENTVRLAKDNNFPPKLQKEIELYEKSGWKYPVSKESTILNYCSEVIKTILQYHNTYKDRDADYELIIDKIFEHKHAANTCRGSELSLKELDKLKQYLKDEKLYYDFLR